MKSYLVILAAAILGISVAATAQAAGLDGPQKGATPHAAEAECDQYCEAFLKVLHEAHEVVHEQEREAAEYFEEDDVGFRHRAVIRHIIEPTPHARRPSTAERAAKAAAGREGIE
jgi:hypothetical protein